MNSLNCLDQSLISHGTDLESAAFSSASKNPKLFSRKPDVEFCRRLREAKSKIDLRGEFAGFYSPSNKRPEMKSPNPDVKGFEIRRESKGVGKGEEDGLRNRHDRDNVREALRPLPNNCHSPDGFAQISRKERVQRPRRSKENLTVRNDQSRLSSQLDQTQRELFLLKQSNEVLQQENASLKAKIEQYEFFMNQQIQKANNLQEQRDSAWNEIARLREKIQDLEGYTNHLKDNLNDAVNSSIYNNGLVEKLEKQNLELREQLQYLQYAKGVEIKAYQQKLASLQVEIRTYRKLRFDSQVKKKSLQQHKKLLDANKRLRISTLDLRERLAQLQHRNSKDDIFELSPQKQT